MKNIVISRFKRYLLYLFVIVLAQSCDIQKEASKQKNDIDFTERIETKEVRKGDTVTYIVPNVIYKDTVITTVSRQGTVLKTYYDNKGNISKSDCISAEIDLLRNEIRTLNDQSKFKESSKTESIDNTFIYIIAGSTVLIFLILVTFLFLYLKSMNKKTDALLQLVQNKM